MARKKELLSQKKNDASTSSSSAPQEQQQQPTAVATIANVDDGDCGALATASSSSPIACRRRNSPPKVYSNLAASSSTVLSDEHVSCFLKQLSVLGLTLRDIQGDGNCLFRALGDQLDGHPYSHMKHRMDTVRYMIAHRGDFEPFIDMPFNRYMDNLSRMGTYAGQDALVAFARLHRVSIMIHQLNSPLWLIEGGDGGCDGELHLSYHNGEHYSSVRRAGDCTDEPAQIRLDYLPTTVVCCNAQQTMSTTSLTTTVSTIPSQHPTESNYWPVSTTVDTVKTDTIESDLLLDDGPERLVELTMLRAQCEDQLLAGSVLAEYNYDVEQAVDYLLSLSLLVNDGKTDNESIQHGDNVDGVRSTSHRSQSTTSILPITTNRGRKVLRKNRNKRRQESAEGVFVRSKLGFMTL